MKKSLVIKLISPRMSLRPMDSEYKRRMSPSLSLVTIASLTPAEHVVYIEDENLGPINYDDLPDIVGITVNVDTAYRAFDISRRYREKGVKVVFGGIHASADPDGVEAHCDAVCIGEAEELWPAILADAAKGTLLPRYYNELITDLKHYPTPEWDYISKEEYLYHNIIITSRGCPFRCEFCYNSCEYVKNCYRNRPVSHVLDEIKMLNMSHLMFIDDNLIGNLEWVDEFLDRISPLKLVWHSAVSANLVHHPGVIKKMAASGCRSLFIGFESINSESIRSVNKKQNKIADYERLVQMLHDEGIMVNASLVFGFDFDKPDTFAKTLDWLTVNKIETMTSHILTPYPGTKLYKKLHSEGRIIDYNLRNYNTSNVVFKPKHMTPGELKKGYLKLYKDFYSLGTIIKRLPDNKKITPSYLMFNLGYRKFGKITSLAGKAGFMKKIGSLGRRLAYGIS